MEEKKTSEPAGETSKETKKSIDTGKRAIEARKEASGKSDEEKEEEEKQDAEKWRNEG